MAEPETSAAASAAFAKVTHNEHTLWEQIKNTTQRSVDIAYGTDPRHGVLARAVADEVAFGKPLPWSLGRHFGRSPVPDPEPVPTTTEEARQTIERLNVRSAQAEREAERLRTGLRVLMRDWSLGWEDADPFDQRDAYRALSDLLGADYDAERTWIAPTISSQSAEETNND